MVVASPDILLHDDLAMRLDPVLLAQAAGIEPDPWQASVLRSRHQRILLNISRQAGKTTTTALLCLWTCLFEPGSLVLMVAPSIRQSSELFKVALDIYRKLGRPVASEIENRLSLELSNGSRLVALPGHESTIRGFAGARLIAADESSRITDDLLIAIRPMVAVSHGRIIALSTPAGMRGWWWEAFVDGGDEWQRFQVKASECPRIDKQFLAEERRALGPTWFAQEYECQFVNAENSVFPESYLQRIVTTEKHAWSIPPAPWAQQQAPTQTATYQQSQPAKPESWSAQINQTAQKRDPRADEQGVVWWPNNMS